MIDPAMLRPGRLGTSVFVDLPTPDERVEILKALYKKALPEAETTEVNSLESVARDVRCTGYSGADLGNLHQAAAVAALKREMAEVKEAEKLIFLGVDAEKLDKPDLRIVRADWDVALGKVRASVKDAGKYRRLKERGM
jgi:ribosome biogenesis ATPase